MVNVHRGIEHVIHNEGRGFETTLWDGQYTSWYCIIAIILVAIPCRGLETTLYDGQCTSWYLLIVIILVSIPCRGPRPGSLTTIGLH